MTDSLSPPPIPADMSDGAAVLNRLFATIESRKGADPSESYTAKLFAKGVHKVAQKVGEEAVETVIEALRGDKVRLAAESADLLYHLLTLWAACDLPPDDVWSELRRREVASGYAHLGREGA